MQLAVVRDYQIKQLEKTITIAAYIINSTPEDALRTYRDGGDGWTALETLCHLRDFEAVFIARAQVTLSEDKPTLPRPDPDELASEKRYNTDDPQAVLEEWRTNRAGYLALLNSIDDEDSWARIGIHPISGEQTLTRQLVAAAWHDTNHLEQITRTLTQKQIS